MEEAQWDIKEIKQLKKKQLVRSNLFMLLVFILLGYLFQSGHFLFIVWLLLAFLFIVLVHSIYALKTGKFIGTKTSKYLNEFDRHRSGEKGWKRTKIHEIVFLIVLGVGMAVVLYLIDFSSPPPNVSHAHFPFIGAWIGYNLGEIAKMKNLKKQPEHG